MEHTTQNLELFETFAALDVSGNGTAAALKDAMTKELQHGRTVAGSIGGPMFDQQTAFVGGM